jgi:hypothetical protein
LLRKLLLVVLCLASLLASEPRAHVSSQVGIARSVFRTPTGTTGREEQRVHNGVDCTVRYDWPTLLSEGYFPVRVLLRNTTSNSLRVDVSAEVSWSNEDLVQRNLILAPSQEVDFELMVRARKIGMNSYQVAIEVDGKKTQFANYGPAGTCSRNVMLVGASAPVAGQQESLAKLWTTLDKSTHWAPGSGPTSVSLRTFDQLSSNWQAYTSLDVVVVDLSGGAPPELFTTALAAWCRAGGTLAVLGGSRSELEGLPALVPALAKRFKILPQAYPTGSISPAPSHPPSNLVFQKSGLVGYRFGFGTLVVMEGPPTNLPNTEPDAAGLPLSYIASSAAFPDFWTRDIRKKDSVQEDLEGALGGFAELPLRSLMVFMLVFALVMGPVNFIWVWRKKQPMLLLVSVPLIALVSSIFLLVYGVISQGLETRSISNTWAVLDQGAQIGTFQEVRRVFAGTSPSEGLRPQAGTVVFPSDESWDGSWREEKLFVADYSEGLVLSGAFFPVRQPFSQLISSDRASRLRVIVKQAGDVIDLSNGLGVPIERLLLRDHAGQYHVLSEALGQGASARLVLAGAQSQLSEWRSDMSLFWGKSTVGLIPGSYLAELSAPPLQDDCGVPMDVSDGRHVLLGILEAQEL